MKIEKIWFEDEKIFILTDEKKTLWQSLLWYPRLKNATEKQRMRYEYDEMGIHWHEIDEDVSVESFLYDNPEPAGISLVFHQYPELNASAVARRMGMKQSLLAAYISGKKKPSVEQTNKIRQEIHSLAKELSAVQF